MKGNAFNRWGILLLLILTSLIYFNNIRFDFVNWDDQIHILNNADIKSLSLTNLRHIFSSFYSGMYQPLSTFSYALEYSVFGQRPSGYHMTNLLLHLINILLVYILTKELLIKSGPALIVTMIFALHPLQTESVGWISARSNLFYSMFFLVSLLCYLSYIRDRKFLKFYWLCMIFFIASLFSKASAITLPAVLLLIDLRRDSAITWKHLLEKIPFLLLSVVFLIIAASFHSENAAFEDISSRFPWYDRIFLASYSVIWYIVKAIVPVNLSALYPYPDKNGIFLPVFYYLSAALIVFLIFFIRKIRNHELRANVIFGLLFFLVNIIIVLPWTIFSEQIVADRHMYLPLVGLAFTIIILSSDLSLMMSGTARRWIVPVIISILAFAYSISSFSRAQVWADSKHLWMDVVAKHEQMANAWLNLGIAYQQNFQYDSAMVCFNKVIDIEPRSAKAYSNRGIIKGTKRDLASAIRDFDTAITLLPSYAEAYSNRANANHLLYRFDNALNDYNRAIELNPGYAAVFYNRGRLLLDMNRLENGIDDFSSAISIDPRYAEAYYMRGHIYFLMEETEKGCADYKRAGELGFKPAASEWEKMCGEK